MTTNDAFASFAPTLPTVPAELREVFFSTAPGGTVVEIDDELYQRAGFGNRWLGLNDVTVDNSYGGASAVYEDFTPEAISSIATSRDAEVFVVRIGGSRN